MNTQKTYLVSTASVFIGVATDDPGLVRDIEDNKLSNQVTAAIAENLADYILHLVNDKDYTTLNLLLKVSTWDMEKGVVGYHTSPAT